MRKGLKIKSLTLLLAWLIIFAHGIIPHNHIDELIPECKSIFHGISSDDTRGKTSGDYKNIPSQETVCHYSGFIFGHMGTDDQVLLSETPLYICPTGSPAPAILYTSENFPADSHTGISFLRAPPLL